MKSRRKSLPFLIGGAALLALDIGRRIYRETQIFSPDRAPVRTWDPVDYGIPAGAVDEHWIDTPDGEKLHAWYCRAEKPQASALFCHGNTGNLTISADVMPHLLNAGLNVLLFDYRGFGKSSGRPSYRGVIADGVTAAKFHDSIRPQLPSILYGFSLGGAVAAQVLRRHPFDALILQSTFTSLPEITRVLYPRLPMHLLAGRLFDTLSVIRKLEVPLLVLHGSADEVAPCWMAHQIHDACPTPKRIHTVEGGLHKDIFERDADSLVSAVSQFIAEVPRREHPIVVEDPPAIERWSASALRALRRAIRKVPA
ncbi:MAG TPA: alpha/beta fold hydrolase [Thermoanaerobaculia bacterium]|nr:alpha/beta fold hydrolase [Thermoanaerobaculia bacterium]